MRVSTGMIYDSGLASIQNRTSTLLRVQEQLSSGRRILAPSDDPVSAARALQVSQAMAANKAQAATRDNVKNTVGLAEAQLQSANELLVRVRELTVQSGNAALSLSDRRSIALELRQRFTELVGIANAKDGQGNSLFGGFQVGNDPFSGSVENGVKYLGDDGVRYLQVSNSRRIGVNQSGNDIFMRLQSGNGTFATSMQGERATNAAHITYEGRTVLAPAATTGEFELKFWSDAAGGNAPAPAQTVGTLNAFGVVVPGGNDQFSVDLGDGNGARTVTLDPALAATSMAGAVQSGVDAALGAGKLVVNADVDGHLVLTTVSSGAGSTFTLADVNGGLATLGLAAGLVGGSDGAAGTTYYDLVDSAGNSLFSGTPSTAGGGANTYTHAYTSGVPLALTSAGPTAFDYGASIAFSGLPEDGDSFAIRRTTSELTVTESHISASRARATIDAGSVSDALKWRQSANSGNLEVRFWVDIAGDTNTSAQAAGTILPTYPISFAANQGFSVDIDGAGPLTVDLAPAGAITYDTPQALQTALQSALGTAASASFDADGRLVVTSNTQGGNSSLVFADGAGSPLTALMGGVPGAATGTDGAVGQTYYDLVDATTGKSLFTGTESSMGGTANTFTHAYTSGEPIQLSSPGGGAWQAFDFGSSVTVSGMPASGDTFVLESRGDYTGNGEFVTGAKTETRHNSGSGIIGAGQVLDAAKWNHPANSRNLEVRFWQDPADTANPKTTYYDLVDAETEVSLYANTASSAGGAGNTYTHVFHPGDAIDFSHLNVPYGLDTVTDFGISVSIAGQPASGDAFNIQASQGQSVFDTLARTITLLESDTPQGTAGNTYFANELGAILGGLSQVEDSILAARAGFGVSLGEVDSLDSVGEALNIQYEDNLSRLQDLDYAEAITKLQRQQMELQAAQQSFSRISQLSLFNYIS